MQNNQQHSGASAPSSQPAATSQPLPSLLAGGYGTYQTRPENFLLSFLSHVLLLLLLLGTYHFAIGSAPKIDLSRNNIVDIGAAPIYHLGKGGTNAGGGGDASKIKASSGTPPKAARQQFTPPQVLPPQQSKLQVPQTVIADLNLPQSPTIGDPLSKLMTASNGSGVGGGIGSGSGGGVGPGRGPGVGPGVFRCCGSGVSAPKPIETPEPEFSEEARKAKYQGVVVLDIIVGTDGRVHSPHVVRSLGMGLDEKAKEKVLTWKFEPAIKDGRPVAVQMNIEVSFNLY